MTPRSGSWASRHHTLRSRARGFESCQSARYVANAISYSSDSGPRAPACTPSGGTGTSLTLVWVVLAIVGRMLGPAKTRRNKSAPHNFLPARSFHVAQRESLGVFFEEPHDGATSRSCWGAPQNHRVGGRLVGLEEFLRSSRTKLGTELRKTAGSGRCLLPSRILRFVRPSPKPSKGTKCSGADGGYR